MLDAAWSGRTPIDGGPNERCEPYQITYYAPIVHNYTQCLRPYTDVLANRVRQEKRWVDCDALLGVWRSSTRREAAATKPRSLRRMPLYVDAGANIGSCTDCVLEQARALAPLAASSRAGDDHLRRACLFRVPRRVRLQAR